MKLSVPLGAMDQEPRQTDEEFAALLGKNRERYCVSAKEEARVAKPPPVREPEPGKPKEAEREAEAQPETAARERAQAPLPEKVAPAPSKPEVPQAEPAPKAPPKRPAPPPPREPALLGRGGPQHKYLQELIKRFAEERGYRAVIEKPILGGKGSVDVSLEKDSAALACEISVTSTVEQELGNVEKCLSAGYDRVILLSSERKRLDKLKQGITSALSEGSAEKVLFLLPEEFIDYVDQVKTPEEKVETVRGYKVKVRYQPAGEEEHKSRRQAIAKVISESLKRMK